MRKFVSVVIRPIFVFLTVQTVFARDMRNRNVGLLLSALCIEDGNIRETCLEDISSVSIRNFIDKLLDQLNKEERYGKLPNDINTKDVLERVSDVVPEKRAREREDLSGFYSNW
ncbi:hypothetical protein CHS0354_009480 [Potamilus streckersoni]|uniref:Uncharacterized protein n=1 Tax=Potamilus streckersoni TaxID=2493646 RepID=A0AAE0RVT0_9BIVA|nr:hypothetical protein CHS0354_009480 [Potamilus streckersoni]